MVRVLWLVFILFFGLLMYGLVRSASIADRHMEYLHELELLGREDEQNGNQPENSKAQI
jgi:hypothetical protein